MRSVATWWSLRTCGDDEDPPNDVFLLTRTKLDISGNVLEVVDARENTAQVNVHGMLGQVLHTHSEDAGDRWMLGDVMGAPLRVFDGLDRTHRFQYDVLRRPTHHFVQPDGGSEALVLLNVWGEIATSPEEDNLRGQLIRQYDGAGLVENRRFHFAGHLLEQWRTLTVAYASVPDWIDLAEATTLAALDAAHNGLIEDDPHTTETKYDALGRPVKRTTPDGSVTRYAYNRGGLRESVEADVRGATPATTFVQDIEYDVYGRRASVEHGNGTRTEYEYDPLSFRVHRIHTTQGTSPSNVQDLRYTYDPVGNVVEVSDEAQQQVYFDNAVVDPHQKFEYDAIYRLVKAEGREHASQNQRTENEFIPVDQPYDNDPNALRTYVEEYTYDEVGNLTEVHHAWSGSSWTRAYDYDADGNRLLASSLPGDTIGSPETYSATYDYDAHGNMTAMPHLEAIDWDHADRMQHADLNGGGDVYFQYDAEGNRVRKVRINQSGSAANERIYLGGFELYRERDVDAGELSDIDLERETLHIADDTGRIVMVETRTVAGGVEVTSPANVARYQYGNHLGSVSLELDDAANVISYEEYHPYGTSAYRAVDSTIEVSAKRYRYAAAERDEETGLDHMGLRYYAPWLGRWTSADPIGLGDGVNRYAYVHGNPVGFVDPGGKAARPPKQEIQFKDDDIEPGWAPTPISDQDLSRRLVVLPEHGKGRTPYRIGELPKGPVRNIYGMRARIAEDIQPDFVHGVRKESLVEFAKGARGQPEMAEAAKRLLADLEAAKQAAANAGDARASTEVFGLTSVYRDADEQFGLQTKRIAAAVQAFRKANKGRDPTLAEQEALAKSLSGTASPGRSLHQQGLTLDFVNPEGGKNSSSPDAVEKWRATFTYEWLAEHAHEYGFHELLTRGREEPWHWDYDPLLANELAAWGVNRRGLPPKGAAAAASPSRSGREYEGPTAVQWREQ